MARISRYNQDELFSNEDMVIGSSYTGTVNGVKQYRTRNYPLHTIRDYIGDKNYVHEQAVASTTWTVNHGMDKFPTIFIQDSAGSSIIGDIEYVDNNTVRVTFAVALSGKVYCN